MVGWQKINFWNLEASSKLNLGSKSAYFWNPIVSSLLPDLPSFNCQFLGAFKISVAGKLYFCYISNPPLFVAMAIGNLLQFVASFTALPELFLCGRFLAGIFSPLCDTCMIM